MKNRKQVKKLVNLLLTGLLVLGAGLGNLFSVSADEKDVNKNNESMRIGVSAVLPKNQIDKNQSYFDLLMAPGAEQELEVTLSNSSDEEVTVELHANTAITNDNGVVAYNIVEEAGMKDASLKHSFSEISEETTEIKIPKKSSTNTKIKVKMPEEAFKGVIAGGIYVTEKEDAAKEDQASGGVQIKNKFVYVIGVQLRNEESLEGMDPELKLDGKKILPKHINYRNVLGINLQNDQPVYIRDMEIDAKVYKGNSTEVLHETKKEGLKMAPNSNFNFGVDWENKEFKGGKYRAVVRAYSKDYDKEWNFEEEFTIDKELAEKLNKEAIDPDKDYTMWIYLGIAALILLLILVIVLLVKNSRDKKKRRNRRSSRKGKSSSAKKKGKKTSKK